MNIMTYRLLIIEQEVAPDGVGGCEGGESGREGRVETLQEMEWMDAVCEYFLLGCEFGRQQTVLCA